MSDSSASFATGRRVLGRGLLLGALALLAACAGVGGPRTFTLSEAELTQRVAEQFPWRKRYLELFDLNLSDPQIQLMPEQNRIGTRLAGGSVPLAIHCCIAVSSARIDHRDPSATARQLVGDRTPGNASPRDHHVEPAPVHVRAT